MFHLIIRELGSCIPDGIKKLSVEKLPNIKESLEPGPHQVLVDIKAAAVNFPDLLMTCGGYQYKPKLPFTPGTEASGIVIKVGQSVKRIHIGDKIICMSRQGMISSQVLISKSACIPIPKGLNFKQAASFNVAYSTAYHCLIERAKLTSRDSVLINGATGGVGLAAVEIARVIGCKTIIATGTSSKKLNIVKRYGATSIIDLQTIDLEKIPTLIKNLTDQKGVNVVYDPVGGELFNKSLRSTAWGARVVVVGFVSGIRPVVRTNYALIKGLSILGCRAGEYARRNPSIRILRMQQLSQWAKEGKIKPHVSHQFNISDAIKAFTTVYERKVIGKAVITFETYKAKL